MARTRLLKPSFFTNEHLAECDPLARLLFAGLWCLADRAGKLHDRPRKIRVETLPYDDVDVEALLGQLESRGFIVRYTSGGEHYIQIVNFERHQHPHPKEPKSTLPGPETAGPGKDTFEPCKVHGEPCKDPVEPVLQSFNPSIFQSFNPLVYSSPKPRTRRVKAPHEAVKEKKENYGEFGNVALTDVEYTKLTERLGGERRAREAIEILGAYKQSKGKIYKSDYAAILQWVIEKLQEREAKASGSRSHTTSAGANTNRVVSKPGKYAALGGGAGKGSGEDTGRAGP